MLTPTKWTGPRLKLRYINGKLKRLEIPVKLVVFGIWHFEAISVMTKFDNVINIVFGDI